MRLSIDTETQSLSIESAAYDNAESRALPLYSKEAFEILSKLWLKTSWDQKYSYTFTWLGRPMIQHPEDMIRLQEVIFTLKPDVIIETGVAHGGSLIYYASLCHAMGKGRIVGVDLDIRTHNRSAIESHCLAPLIQLVEGDSVAPEIVQEATRSIQAHEVVMIILDSNHARHHVLAELNAYHPYVTQGAYIVATDGLMQDLFDVPRGHAEWQTDNPVCAVQDFLKTHPDFVLETPAWAFNESPLTEAITAWPSAWLKRL